MTSAKPFKYGQGRNRDKQPTVMDGLDAGLANIAADRRRLGSQSMLCQQSASFGARALAGRPRQMSHPTAIGESERRVLLAPGSFHQIRCTR